MNAELLTGRVHVIGIGGIGVSGLSRMLLRLGARVRGSDSASSPTVGKLRRLGIPVAVGQRPGNVRRTTDLVVYSQAVRPDNPEYRRALELGIPAVSHPEAVGMLMAARRGVAVAGTHGKTTTSALVVHILRSARRRPSFLIGGEIPGSGNSGFASGPFLVVEACEYRRSFLNYRPEIAVVTNIEEDHLDYYRDIREIEEAFAAFCANVRPDGAVVACADEPRALRAAAASGRRVVTYGLAAGSWRASNIARDGLLTRYDCALDGRQLGRTALALGGRHNVLNSLAAAAAASEAGVPWPSISRALGTFPGVRRRCERRGVAGGVTVIDDYGHHPTEIRATLASLREGFPADRLIVVFQPHQYSRTRFLLKDFAASFTLADKVVVPDIYFVRDSVLEMKHVNAAILADRIRRNGREALYLPTFDEIVAYLREIVRPGDVVLTLGAGPVHRVGDRLLREIRRHGRSPDAR